MEPIKIGIMGCANIAKRSMIPALLELSDLFKVSAISSRTPEKAKQYADIFNIAPIIGYENLFKEDIDAIYMPLPTGLHAEWIEKALLAGKHVYAEKSFAMNHGDAKRLVELAKDKELALMEGYMFLHHKQHATVKRLLKEGTIGELRNFKASFAFPPFPDKDNFRYDNKIGGGALKDAAGYVLRSVEFICEHPYKISDATIHYNHDGTSIYGTAYVKMRDGISGYLSFGFDNFYQCNYEIWGTKGKLTVNKAFTPKPNEETTIKLERQDGIETFRCEPFNHFVAAMKYYHKLCIGTEDREKEYKSILLQSKGLDEIEQLSKK